MSNPLSGVEGMIDDWERSAEEKAARYQAMSREVERISIIGSAAGGAVTVTVGHNGIPAAVSMTAQVRKMTPEQIAAAVMEAMTDAQSRFPQRLAEVMADTVGETATTRHLLAQARESFPSAPGADPKGEPASRQRGDDEDFGDRTFLRGNR